jgi:triosephosphate isomerase
VRLVAANWKMNLDPEAARRWVDAVAPVAAAGRAEVAVFPSFPLVPLVAAWAGGRLAVGAQNCGVAQAGAFTGEVSPALLAALGCRFVLTGHSERRRIFGEDPELVARRTAAALEAGLRPIVCVGEAEGEDRERVLDEQLRPLAAFGAAIDVAYEPVWAIGSGRAADPADVAAARAVVRRRLNPGRFLYGGSVTPANAAAYLAADVSDGLLVGTASLDPAAFAALLEVAGDAA